MKLKYYLLSTLTVAFLCTGCSGHKQKPKELSNIAAFENDKHDKAIGNIRYTAIHDTALALGAQTGLAWRAKHINEMLKSQTDSLNKTFNFNALILDNNVLPPVLTESHNTLKISAMNALRLADTSYKIVAPPRFVTAAPNWRQYLWLNYKKPEKPHETLLPKTDGERKVWNKAVAKGWEEGVKQANQIFSANVGRLKRDFNGMVLYRKMLAQNMVSKPYVAKADLGVTGGGTSMRVNDRILRITAIPNLNSNSATWQPALSYSE